MKVYLLINIFMALALLSFETAQARGYSWREEDLRPGYAEELKPENDEVGEILYMVDNPYRNDVKMSEQIFDPTLKKDITQRYREQFGRTEAEIITERTPYLNSNFSEGASITFDAEDYQVRQQKFGKYIAKRLGEHHLEKEAKESSSLRGVYVAKKTLENTSVSAGSFKIRARYRLSSNSMLAYVKNPYLDFETRVELSGDRETVCSVSKNLGRGYSVYTDYYIVNPRWDIIGRKSLTPALSVSLTYSPIRTIEVDEGAGLVKTKYTMGTVGLSYAF